MTTRSTARSWANRVYAAARETPRTRWLRKRFILHHYGVRIREHPVIGLRYVLTDPEVDNFTYPLSNEDELAAFVAATSGASIADVERYLCEVHNDDLLNRGLVTDPRKRLRHKGRAYFGRRLIWYALARALKPTTVVETGIHDGLGSALLLSALERNAREGVDGQLISVDINPRAGWLVPNSLRRRWIPVYGSTFDVLPSAIAGSKIGMFIHDSEHTYECETFEFTTALAHADTTLALVSDNSHATSALRDVCADNGITYRLFLEKPRSHFYPGAGAGVGIRTTEPSTG